MKISILYFDGCPNHRPVVEMAKRLVHEHGLDAHIEEVEVAPDDVVRLRFLGSPTVQIDGVDIEPAARDRTDFAMSCRVYATPDGLPSVQMLLGALGVSDKSLESAGSRLAQSYDCCGASPPDALSPEHSDRARRTGLLAVGGSVASGALSSACCWLPLLLLTFGASAAGVSVFFERWRPIFIVVAVAMLSLGFYFGYFHKASCAGECSSSRRPRDRRLQRGMLWVSTVIVGAFIFFPSYIDVFLNGNSGPMRASTAATVGQEGRAYVFDIEGMHCQGCAATLRNELAKVDGVIDVGADYDSKTARVQATGERVGERVRAAAARAGYSATLRSEK